MRIQWEADDVYAGLIVQKPGQGEQLIVGYVYVPQSISGDPIRQWTVNSLADGAVIIAGPERADIVEHLNKSGVHPAQLIEVLARARK